MAIIPRYSSRALPPGAQSGLIESAQARGKAGAGLALATGDAIVAGLAYKRRRDAREAAARTENNNSPKGPRSARSGARSVDALKNKIAMGRETVARQAGLGDLADTAGLDAELAVARAGGVAAGRADGGAAGLAARRLAEFDGQAEKSLALFKDRPALKQRADDIVASHARPYEARLLKMEAALRPVEEAARLDRALGLFAEAARLDPAGVDGYIGRGLKALEEAGVLAGLPGQEIAEKQDRFAGTAATAAVRGLIERDPEGALERLESGAFDARFDKADLELLRGEAKTAARAKGARDWAAERARRRALQLGMEEHLVALAETGRGDETLEARARADLSDIEYAVFQADQAAARERYATRTEYAFMTPREIEADIDAGALGGDGDEQRDRTNAIRKAVRDEVLAARAADPAGWAMRDEDVAAAFAAAEEDPDDPALARKATELRLALQREMGIDRPSLLSEAERRALGEELAALMPTERLARIGELKGRYGDRFVGLAQELAGAVAPDTEILMARLDDPILAGVLARGMERDGVEFKGARHLWLPLIDGRLDKSRLEDKQLYQFTHGNRILRVIYDRKVDALVPVVGEGADSGQGSEQPGRLVSVAHGAAQEFVGQFADIPQGMAISEGAVYQGVLGVFNQLEAGEKPDLSKVSGWAKGMDLFRRYLQGDRAQRDALYAEVEGIARGVIGSDLYQAGQWIKDATREALPTNPEYEDEIQQKLARGGGSLAAFVVGGVAGRAVKIPATLITVAMGGYSNATVMFQDAIANGADWEEAYRAAQLGAGAGLTEAIPITRLFGRIDRGAGGSIRRALIEAAKGGTEEALQEGFQAIVNNLIKSRVVGYDPERQTFEGAGENAGISFTLGGLANFIAVAAGIRRRPPGPMDAPQHPAAPQREGPGAEMAPEDTGNAPSGKADVEGDVADAGLAGPANLDASVAGMPMDRARRDQYYESALHPSFRGESPEVAEKGRLGDTAIGLVDPESGKRIIQPVNDAESMRAMAEENVDPLRQQLDGLVFGLPGVNVDQVRAKEPVRMGGKLKRDRRPDTLTDYLGGRIVVDDPLMFDETMRVLTQRYKIVEADEFLDGTRESGYRGIHLQVVLDNGIAAEIQIMPREVFQVYKVEHPNYVKWREKTDLTPEEFRQKEADKTRARDAYTDAYERWLQRGNMKSPRAKNR